MGRAKEPPENSQVRKEEDAAVEWLKKRAEATGSEELRRIAEEVKRRHISQRN